MPRKVGRGKKQSKLSKILGIDRTKYNVVSHLHYQMTGKEIENAVPTLAKHREFSKQINLSVDNNFTNFYDINLPFLDLSKNLSWCIGVLTYHSDRLAKFRDLENVLQSLLLTEDYEQSLLTLDEIDKLCGISVYSLGIRSSIYKISGEDALHTELMSKILDSGQYNSFFKTICKYSMDRYDESSINITSATSTRKQILRTMDEDFSSFLIYKITPKDYLSEIKIDFNVVLEYEKRSSIIDLYKAMLEFVENETINYINMPDYLKNIVVKLNKIASHPITHNVSRFKDLGTTNKEFSFDAELIDLYTKGEYGKVVNKVSLDEKYYGFSTFEIISKSIARYGENPFNGLKSKIVDDICSITLKKDNYYTAYYSLLNICYAYATVPWFQELQLFISKESKFIGETLNLYLAQLVSINAEEDTPRKIEFFDDNHKELYMSYVEEIWSESTTISLFYALLNPDIKDRFTELVPNDIDSVRYKKYFAISLLSGGNRTLAISLLEDVINNGSLIDSYDGLKFLVNAYINNDMPDKAIKIFVSHALSNRNNILIFDVEKIAKSAKGLINNSKDIEVPIALELYTRFVNDDYESALRVSLDNFIINNGFSDPFDLTSDNLLFSQEKVNYFLENVCTTKNMKLSLLFLTKNDIENCRIKICNHLIEINLSRDKLIEEVKSITREHVFRKAIEQVDNSRIYVDVSAFKDERSKAFKAICKRFYELKQQDFSTFEDEDYLTRLSKLLSGIEGSIFDAASSVHIQNVTFNEKNRTFHKLISMLRDEFTFGDKGLNSYLSTRIRHGVLPTELRKSAQSEKLWLVSDGSDIPKIEKYWEENLPSLSLIGSHALINLLTKFTNRYEKIIDEINDSWLQVVSLDQDISNIKVGVNKSQALFNYSISTTETYMIQSLVTDENYNNLIDTVLSWLWHRTDTNLKAVRGAINNKAFDMFRELYVKLEEDILNLKLSDQDTQSLLILVRKSKENVRNTLTSISSWFNRSTVNHIESFDIDTAIDIASRSTNVSVTTSCNNDFKIKGRYLSSFVDILYILFENSVSKCKLPLDELSIQIEILVDENDLIISVCNNCKIIDPDTKNIELDYYRNAYGDSELMIEASQQEGGTGLFKICNTIEKDFDVVHTNDFGYKNENTFETVIRFQNLMEVVRYEDSDC
ncbi:hypothetical protein [Vibrio atlanticus]|uniref:hypothetical protein n=1 Tax=Vibrio atlanticus TaxID=693153 RepID=UPI003D141E97